MPFYYGSSADGSDMKEFRGMYTNPANEEEWSSKPFTKEQRLEDDIYDYCAANLRSYRDEYHLILMKKSKLSSAHRAYLVEIVEKWLWECKTTGYAD